MVAPLFFFPEGAFSTRFFPIAVRPVLQRLCCWGTVMISVFKELESTQLAKVSSCLVLFT